MTPSYRPFTPPIAGSSSNNGKPTATSAITKAPPSAAKPTAPKSAWRGPRPRGPAQEEPHEPDILYYRAAMTERKPLRFVFVNGEAIEGVVTKIGRFCVQIDSKERGPVIIHKHVLHYVQSAAK